MVNLTFAFCCRSYPKAAEERTLLPVHSKIDTVAAWDWTTLEVVSKESTGNSYCPRSISDKEGNLHIVWEDYTNLNGDGSDKDIFYKKFNATTGTWSSTTVVSTESTEASEYPALAADSYGNIHIVWQDNTDYAGAGNGPDIFYKEYSVSSNTWGNTIVLTKDPYVDLIGKYPDIACDSNDDIYVVWQSYSNEICYRKYSTPYLGFRAWGGITVLTEDPSIPAYSPKIAAGPAGDIHIVYESYIEYTGIESNTSIFYKLYMAAAGLWSEEFLVSTESTEYVEDPDIAIDQESNVYIVWMDPTEYDGLGGSRNIVFTRYTVATGLWITPEVISTESTFSGFFPNIAVDAFKNIHVVWLDNSDYNGAGTDYDVFYKSWNSTTTKWSTTLVISTEKGNYEHTDRPTIAIDLTEQVHISWLDIMDYNGAGTDRDIFHQRLTGPPTSAPVLNPIMPNPSTDGNVSLSWTDVYGAKEYHIYRDTTNITSLNSSNPIIVVSGKSFDDTLNTSGDYYYAILATNDIGNSTLSNCETVEILLSSDSDSKDDDFFTFIPDDNLIPLLLGSTIILVILCTILLKRK